MAWTARAWAVDSTSSAVTRSIGFTIGFHNHGEGPYKGRFQAGEGPSRGPLRDCTTSLINRLQHYKYGMLAVLRCSSYGGAESLIPA